MRLTMVKNHKAFGRNVVAGETITVDDTEAKVWVKAGWAKVSEEHEQERRGPGRPKKQIVEGAPTYSRRDLRAVEGED